MTKNNFEVFNLENCFLPNSDPILKLSIEFSDWESLALNLPKLLTSNNTRSQIKDLPFFDTKKLNTAADYERAMLILSFLAHAYVWNNASPVNKLPKNIALPWFQVASHLQRPPVLSYASYALYNWQRIDKSKPIELGNIILLQNFLGGIDEEWFILVHIEIEAKSTAAIQAIKNTLAAQNTYEIEATLQNLQKINQTLEEICKTLDRMPEHCDPYIYYRRVRPYIHGWKNNPSLPNGLIYEGVEAYGNQPQMFKGETGAQSSIMPMLDAFLGIKHENTPLQQHLIEMRDYMPFAHRKFIKEIESKSFIRDFVLQNKNNSELKKSYNNAIKLIQRFRQTHIQYAAQYIQKQSQTSSANPINIGTGGTPFMKYLNKHLQETENSIVN